TPSNTSVRSRAPGAAASRARPSRPVGSSREARATSVKPARASAASSVPPRELPPDLTRRASDHAHAGELVRGDLGAVVGPLLSLVREEVVEHVLPQRLGDQLGLL